MTMKTFDAVKLMRDLRDRLGQEMQGMAPEERLQYIRDKASSIGIGTDGGKEAGQQADATDRPSI